MAPAVQRYFAAGLATSTQRTYAAALKRFHRFCVKYNVCSPFPVTEFLLCSFAASLADEGLAPQTGKTYLAAVRSMQISLGLPDPREHSAMPALKRVQAGIRRAHLLRGNPPRIRLPVTATVLLRVHHLLAPSAHPDKVALWAIACTAFFGFFRMGELLPASATAFNQRTHLAWGDIALDSAVSPRSVKIHLKTSKCDQFGSGADIYLGRTGTTLCPVAAISAFMVLRGPDPGPFFVDHKGQPVVKAWFVAQFREVLTSAGLPQTSYSGHSFRIGAATSAAQAGIEDSTIQSLGRWSSTAFLQYIRLPREELAAVSPLLAGPSRTAANTA